MTKLKTEKLTKKLWVKDPLDEAKTVGYIEGFSDGRNNVIDELVELNLLKPNWKKEYNKKTKGRFLIK